MILPMVRLRMLGPRGALEPTLAALQDLGMVHLADPGLPESFQRFLPPPAESRHRRQVLRLLADLDALAERIALPAPAGAQPAVSRATLAQWRRLVRRVTRILDRLAREQSRIAASRAALQRASAFLRAFAGLAPGPAAGIALHQYHLVLRGGPRVVTELGAALGELLGPGFDLRTRPLTDGEMAVLLLVPSGRAAEVDGLLRAAGIEELPLPGEGQVGGSIDPAEAVRRAEAKLDDAARHCRAEEATLCAAEGPELAGARAVLHDLHLREQARAHVAGTAHSFVLEGWLPRGETARVRALLRTRVPAPVVVEELDRSAWHGEAAPVVMRNPRLFRPFEAVTGLVPLPRYGSIDPTPFVATFFPMFFGLILGDIGYGLLLAAVALGLRWRSAPGTRLRAISEIGGAAAAFTIAFGLAFGEFFGDLGRHRFGLQPVLFDREAKLLAFLGLAVALGMVHVLLGLVLGTVNAIRGHQRRHAVGRGAGIIMLLLLAGGLLAAVQVLPAALLTPTVTAILVLFPVLVVAEGILAPLELLSTISSILSYARIMALGTASVMMAVVANQLAGTFGSVVVGVVFALLFHLVNFALGVFAPTVHALRLHYVEFFGKFYSPGGTAYAPLAHWHPAGVALE